MTFFATTPPSCAAAPSHSLSTSTQHGFKHKPKLPISGYIYLRSLRKAVAKIKRPSRIANTAILRIFNARTIDKDKPSHLQGRPNPPNFSIKYFRTNPPSPLPFHSRNRTCPGKRRPRTPLLSPSRLALRSRCRKVPTRPHHKQCCSRKTDTILCGVP